MARSSGDRDSDTYFSLTQTSTDADGDSEMFPDLSGITDSQVTVLQCSDCKYQKRKRKSNLSLYRCRSKKRQNTGRSNTSISGSSTTETETMSSVSSSSSNTISNVKSRKRRTHLSYRKSKSSKNIAKPNTTRQSVFERLVKRKKEFLIRNYNVPLQQFTPTVHELPLQDSNVRKCAVDHKSCQVQESHFETCVPQNNNSTGNAFQQLLSASYDVPSVFSRLLKRREHYLTQLNRASKETKHADAVKRLQDSGLIGDLVTKLEEKGLVKDFLILVESISTGLLNLDNVSVRSTLELAKFLSLSDSRGMSYSDITRSFWHCAYRLLGGPALRFFSGPRGVGRNTFDPTLCDVNFAVPSETTLSQMDTDVPKTIDPSIFESVIANLGLLNMHVEQEYILSFDGKGVSQGFRGDNLGDENLLGVEGPPSLEECERRRDEELDIVDSMKHILSKVGPSTTREHICSLIRIITLRIKDMRSTIQLYDKLELKYTKLKENNPDNANKYVYVLSSAKYNKSNAKAAIKRALLLNRDLCECAASLNGARQFLVGGNHVQLDAQKNYLGLKEPEFIPNIIGQIYNDPTKTVYVKQKSDLWHSLRDSALITGSTCFDALGLQTLARQKEHYDKFVLKQNDDEVTAEVNAMFEHGSRNEIHAMATLVSVILPAFKRPCHSAFEVGPVMVDSPDRERMLEVSADGLVMCALGVDCPQECYRNSRNHKYVVEIKSPYNKDNPYYNFRYLLPKRYGPQLLCEMFALDTDKGLFVTHTDESVILCEVSMDLRVWTTMINAIYELYGTDDVKKPTRLHERCKILRSQLDEFCKNAVSVLCEVPSLTGEEGLFLEDDPNSPFRSPPPRVVEVCDLDEIQAKIEVLCAEAECVIRDTHNLSRRKGTELLLFMLSDTDRVKTEENDTYTHPIAYAMKGNSLSGNQMRTLLSSIRDSLQAHKVPVLCECFDGQWSSLCFQDAEGFPLTLLQLQKKSWGSASHLSRKGCIDRISDCAAVKYSDLSDIGSTNLCKGRTLELGNVRVTKDHKTGILRVESLGGNLQSRGLMTMANLSNINVSKWQVEKAIKTKTRSGPQAKITGLLRHEKNLLSTLPQNIRDEVTQEEEDEDEIDLQSYLSRPDVRILEDMATALVELHAKWESITAEDLYPDILTSSSTMMSCMTHKDLNCLSSVISSYNNRSVFPSSAVKLEKVVALGQLFGSGEILRSVSRSVPKLKALARVEVEKFPLLITQVVFAKLCHKLNKAEWESKLNINMQAYIPILDDYIPLFYNPEYSAHRKQVEFRTMDYTHMLTNLRAQISRRGFDEVKTSAFVNICERNPEIVSKAIVMDVLDKQCADFALKFFSEKVERKLDENGDNMEALYVRTIRNWQLACDKSGITADERVNRLWAMYALLCKDVDFDRFPAPGMYVKGIPVVTFGAILQNISTRLSLYSQSSKMTYNARSLSSLVCESFFSTVSMREKNNMGCPKAADVPRLMSNIITIENYKTDTERKFYLKTAKKPFYPPVLDEHMLLDPTTGQLAFPEDGLYTNHFFDIPNVENTRKRRRRTEVNHGNAPLRGVKPVRDKFKYKIDESLVLPHHMPPVPQTNIK